MKKILLISAFAFCFTGFAFSVDPPEVEDIVMEISISNYDIADADFSLDIKESPSDVFLANDLCMDQVANTLISKDTSSEVIPNSMTDNKRRPRERKLLYERNCLKNDDKTLSAGGLPYIQHRA